MLRNLDQMRAMADAMLPFLRGGAPRGLFAHITLPPALAAPAAT